MYRLYARKDKEQENPEVPADCYAEKARNYYWMLGVLITGVILFFIMKYTTQGNREAPVDSAVSAYAKTVAYASCPYCPGYLDSQGRCNVPDCPIYSPDWGSSPSTAADTAGDFEKSILIRQLAAEVSTVAEGAVIIHSVYIGGRAQKAGLLKGDIILSFNGRKVKSSSQFRKIVNMARPESYAAIDYIRDGERFASKIMVGEGEMEGVRPVALSQPPVPSDNSGVIVR